MTKQIIFAIVAAALVSLCVSFGVVSLQPRPHAGATVENYPDWFTQGIQVGGSNSKIVTQWNCATSKISVNATINANVSSTFDVALAGVSTSSNQVYWVGVNTSTAAWAMANIHGSPSSTAGTLSVAVFTSTSSPISVGSTTISACYAQF